MGNLWIIYLWIIYGYGWWLTYPSEQYEFVNYDDDIHNSYEKLKNVPNLQPASFFGVGFSCTHCAFWEVVYPKPQGDSDSCSRPKSYFRFDPLMQVRSQVYTDKHTHTHRRTHPSMCIYTQYIIIYVQMRYTHVRHLIYIYIHTCMYILYVYYICLYTVYIYIYSICMYMRILRYLYA